MSKILQEYLTTKELSSIMYLDTDLNLSATKVRQIVKSVVSRLNLNYEESNSLQSLLENAIYVYKLPTGTKMLNFINSEMTKFMKNGIEGSKVKYLIFDNLSNFLNLSSKNIGGKSHKKYIFELRSYAKHCDVFICIMNNMKYIKSDLEFFLEPEHKDIIQEFVSSIFLLEKLENKVVFKKIKSNLIDNDFLISQERNTLKINYLNNI